ncbi:MAG: hypothetical protein EZS28_034199, partial [Streblomastix strix]
FYDTIGEIFPVQSGAASEDEANEAFLRTEERRINTQRKKGLGLMRRDGVGLDPRDLYDDQMLIELFNQKTFVLNNENLQGLQLVNSNCRGLYFASKTNVKVIKTELIAFISTNVMSIRANLQLKMNQEQSFDGNAGYE